MAALAILVKKRLSAALCASIARLTAAAYSASPMTACWSRANSLRCSGVSFGPAAGELFARVFVEDCADKCETAIRVNKAGKIVIALRVSFKGELAVFIRRVGIG